MLIDEIRELFAIDDGYDPRDIDGVEVANGPGIYDQSRWYTYWATVYKRDAEYVCVITCEGSTEMQDDGFDPPEIFPVTPVEKTIIDYVRID